MLWNSDAGLSAQSCVSRDKTCLPQDPGRELSAEAFGSGIHAPKHSRIQGSIMSKLIKIAVLVAMLGSRAATAETTGASEVSTGSASTNDTSSSGKGLRWRAPVGHRQPGAHDLPSELSGELERISEEDRAADRRLIICRGC
jgi:hypothetical protein